MDVRIENREPVEVVCVQRTGPYQQSAPAAFTALWGWLNEKGLAGQVRGSFGYGQDDPASTPADQLRYVACAQLEGDVEIDGDVKKQTLPGGRYAVYTLKGAYSGMTAAFGALYAEWLPNSGESLGKGPWLEDYLNDPSMTPESALRTDLCMPLQG